MSLINQMLQDLEKRRASGAERGALPSQVRVLPRAESHSLWWKALGIAAVVIVIALLGWQFGPRKAVTVVAAAGDPNPPATEALEPGAPVSRLALELGRVPSNAVTPSPLSSPDSAVPVARAVPKADALAVAGAKPPQGAPVATAVVVASEPAAAKVGPTKAAAAVVEPPRAANPPLVATKPPVAPRVVDVAADAKVQAAATNAQIDKRMQVLTPQQTAENDYREAANFLNQGRLGEAQEGFRHALQNNPAHVGARQGLFGLLLDAKKNAEAEQVLKDGLKINPNQPPFAIALSSLQFERGDIGEAIETLQRTAPAAQSSPDYIARLAGMLQRQSRHREAVEQYQAALRLAPQSGVWQMGMGISLQALGRNAEAQDAFRRAKSSNTLSAELQGFVDQRLRQLQ